MIWGRWWCWWHSGCCPAAGQHHERHRLNREQNQLQAPPRHQRPPDCGGLLHRKVWSVQAVKSPTLDFPPALFASFCPCSTWSCAARSGGGGGLWRALTQATFPLLLRMKRERTCEETKTEQSTWVLLWSFSLSGEYLKTLITESSHLNAATHLANCALANIICQEFSTLLSNELSLYIYIHIYIYGTYKVLTQNVKQTSSKTNSIFIFADNSCEFHWKWFYKCSS